MNWRKAGVVVAMAAALFGVPAGASAGLLGTYVPSPADMNDLDHHMLYAWRITDTSLANKTITGATLTFKQMYNWDNSANVLYLWLLDKSRDIGYSVNGGNVQSAGQPCVTTGTVTSCVTQFQDDTTTNATIHVDDFGLPGGTSTTKPGWLVQSSAMTSAESLSNRSFAGPGASPLTSPGPTATPAGWTHTANVNGGWDYTYTFNAGDRDRLNAFLDDASSLNNFAIGLDPDCHYFNTGIELKLYDGGTPTQTGVVPEPASLLLLGTGLAFLARRRLTRKSA